MVDLPQVRVSALDALLDEETGQWQAMLGWDFRPSAAMVRRLVGLRTLAGAALMAGETAFGYAYVVADDRKGLIGGLFVSAEYRAPAHEFLLLESALNELFGRWAVTRVESQLMMLSSPPGAELPYADRLKVHPRQYMVIAGRLIPHLAPGPAARKALIENWTPGRVDEAASVIAAAYRGHVDSEVNDQYCSVGGSHRFLTNLMNYPGCGAFFAPASFVAVDAWTGRACGVCLASLLSTGVGHITQICVTPALKGKGLGYELMRRSLLALAEAGCRRVSLTVTTSNTRAVRLYERIGFEPAHSFSALVWDLHGAWNGGLPGARPRA
ncbi:MAG: GNAT family N-acetyltransferase [Bryobacterales bacterium]|nr:GNAT family N-acetyltransferase [Bryobacterales bacterium]